MGYTNMENYAAIHIVGYYIALAIDTDTSFTHNNTFYNVRLCVV